VAGGKPVPVTLTVCPSTRSRSGVTVTLPTITSVSGSKASGAKAVLAGDADSDDIRASTQAPGRRQSTASRFSVAITADTRKSAVNESVSRVSTSSIVSKSQSKMLMGAVAHCATLAKSDHTTPEPLTSTVWRSVSSSSGVTVRIGGGARGASGSKCTGAVAARSSVSPTSPMAHALGRQSTSCVPFPSVSRASTFRLIVAWPAPSVSPNATSEKAQCSNRSSAPAVHWTA
jgi:hypothetical protein